MLCGRGGFGLDLSWKGGVALLAIGSPCDWRQSKGLRDFFMAGNNELEPAAKKVGFNFPRVMLLTKRLYATNKRFHASGRVSK
jgi:hypothetical protein